MDVVGVEGGVEDRAAKGIFCVMAFAVAPSLENFPSSSKTFGTGGVGVLELTFLLCFSLLFIEMFGFQVKY